MKCNLNSKTVVKQCSINIELESEEEIKIFKGMLNDLEFGEHKYSDIMGNLNKTLYKEIVKKIQKLL